MASPFSGGVLPGPLPRQAIPRPRWTREVIGMEEVLVFLGVFLGCLARSVLPFLRKAREAAERGLAFSWDHRYTVSFAVALLVAWVSAVLITPSVVIEGPTGPLVVFCTAFAVGFGSNGFLNELMKQAGVV